MLCRTLQVEAVSTSVQDSSVLVQRSTLDLILFCFPFHMSQVRTDLRNSVSTAQHTRQQSQHFWELAILDDEAIRHPVRGRERECSDSQWMLVWLFTSPFNHRSTMCLRAQTSQIMASFLLSQNSSDLCYYFLIFVVCVAVPGHPSRYDSDSLCSAARGSEEGHVTQPQTVRLAAG